MAILYTPNFDGLKEMLADPAIIAALHEVAAGQILPKALALCDADSDDLSAFRDSLRVEDGIRPKGRSFSRVIADDESATALEFGDTDTRRRRILGQAAGVQVNTQGDA